MRPFKITLILLITFYSCKKENGTKPSTPAALLVKTITSRIQKVDSSGYYTTIDSFQYDNQNRVTKYVGIQRDTIFIYDTNGNITNMSPSEIINLITLSYTGSSSTPSTYLFNGQVVTMTANGAGQIIADSSSPTYISHFIYNPGLIVGQLGRIGPNYTLDSIWTDANSNATSFVFGGDYFLDSLNNPKYGRIVQWKYTYGNILNPIYAISSASAIFLVHNNNFSSKYIRESVETISYGQHSEILQDETRNFQNVADANNVIQKSVNISNEEYIAWTYY
jgi:hypothetical protein